MVYLSKNDCTFQILVNQLKKATIDRGRCEFNEFRSEIINMWGYDTYREIWQEVCRQIVC